MLKCKMSNISVQEETGRSHLIKTHSCRGVIKLWSLRTSTHELPYIFVLPSLHASDYLAALHTAMHICFK